MNDEELSQMLEDCSSNDWRKYASEKEISELQDLKKMREGKIWSPFASGSPWPEGVKNM